MKRKRSKRKAVREDRLMLLTRRESQVDELMGKGIQSRRRPSKATRAKNWVNVELFQGVCNDQSECARLLLSQNRRALFNDIIGREREKHSCLGHNGFSFASGLASPSLRASIPIHVRLFSASAYQSAKAHRLPVSSCVRLNNAVRTIQKIRLEASVPDAPASGSSP